MLQWCAVPNIPGQKQFPEWARSAAIDDDGQVFVPAILAGDEKMVMLCMLYDETDGTAAVVDSDHIYVPARWLAREFPDVRELCEKVEASVRKLFSDEAV